MGLGCIGVFALLARNGVPDCGIPLRWKLQVHDLRFCLQFEVYICDLLRSNPYAVAHEH